MTQQTLTNICPYCQSTNVAAYKKIWLGIILILFVWPAGLLYLILTPKYKCQNCKKLFPRIFEGTKTGKVGNAFLVLIILFLLFGLITFIAVTIGS